MFKAVYNYFYEWNLLVSASLLPFEPLMLDDYGIIMGGFFDKNLSKNVNFYKKKYLKKFKTNRTYWKFNKITKTKTVRPFEMVELGELSEEKQIEIIKKKKRIVRTRKVKNVNVIE